MGESVSLPGGGLSHPSRGSGCKTILIADDSEVARNAIRTSLVEAGFQVCGEAVDGLDAVEKARVLKPDLILLDLAMPQMNGVVAASVLRREMPHIPVVVLTVHENELGNVMGGSLASAVGVKAALSKHEGIAKLLDCVRSLIGPR